MTKLYAVKKGNTPGIYNSWNEYKEQVSGFKGAEYKSFKNLADAETFMQLGLEMNDQDLKVAPKVYERMDKLALELSKEENTLCVYSDGSNDQDGTCYLGGFLILDNENIVARHTTSGDKPELAKLRNVAGEMQASIHAIKHISKSSPDTKTIHMFVDYQGLYLWLLPKSEGGWQAKNEFTKAYVEFMEKMQKSFNIVFHHVKGHNDDPFNEEADTLATYSNTLFLEKRIFDLDEFLKDYSYLEKQK